MFGNQLVYIQVVVKIECEDKLDGGSPARSRRDHIKLGLYNSILINISFKLITMRLRNKKLYLLSIVLSQPDFGQAMVNLKEGA